jgi:hypothetical protein
MNTFFAPSTLWSLGAALLAVVLEYCYRTFPAPWENPIYLAFFLVAQCVIGLAIYKIVNTPGVPLVGALIVWSFATIFMRVVVSSVFLHDKISPGTWCAVLLLLVARFAQTFWK